MGPAGVEPTRSLAGAADFKSAASASSATGPINDSEQSRAVLEALQSKDWKRLGVLLGAMDEDLCEIISVWRSLPPEVRQAIRVLVSMRSTPDRQLAVALR